MYLACDRPKSDSRLRTNTIRIVETVDSQKTVSKDSRTGLANTSLRGQSICEKSMYDAVFMISEAAEHR